MVGICKECGELQGITDAGACIACSKNLELQEYYRVTRFFCYPPDGIYRPKQ